MSVHDTIGDFITVIRNAGQAGKSTCSYPHSNLRLGIAQILKSRGFVENCDEESTPAGHKNIQITLKYIDGEHAIRCINRVSTYHVFWEVLEFQFSALQMVLLMTNQLEKTN